MVLEFVLSNRIFEKKQEEEEEEEEDSICIYNCK
jgi:hypothetical protein